MVLASRVGGVDNLVKNIGKAAVAKAAPVIGKAAVAKAAPKIYCMGAGAGALGTLAAGGVAVAVRNAWREKRAREACAKEAGEQTETAGQESVNSGGVTSATPAP
ncbi:hypothetical protein E6P78_05255 [Streptomyces sp. A0958]|uniref:hypothetical protein n=1 Tax=Streptomyces sp. A0958 TaxID=2563101 RepID=UPI00109EA2D4|nr:hypothetical protein [Streptomyces sp. A0958]THA71968.1 hypothetical protein E6P78_05255 [Streptomyces sp. A0958]